MELPLFVVMFKFHAVTIIFGLTLFAVHAQSAPVELESLRASWVDAKGKEGRPIKKKYYDSLVALQENFTRSGKLEDAVAVRDEIEALTQGKEGEKKLPSTSPAQLRASRKIYEREMELAIGKIDQKYSGALKAILQHHTQAGDLKSALAVQAEIDRVGQAVDIAEERPEAKFIGQWDFRYKGAKRIFQFEEKGTFSGHYPHSGKSMAGDWKLSDGDILLKMEGESTTWSTVSVKETDKAEFVSKKGFKMSGRRIKD